jgi:alpha-D-ribose 1-methylphosphonate 5-triphosphate synthase subunit PhnG
VRRARRTRILVEGSGELLSRLAAQVEGAHVVTDIEAPGEAMVMIEARESARLARFYLGEVLVTEAKVEVEGTMGLGLLAGMDGGRARELAIVDAAYAAGLLECAAWEAELLGEEAKIEAARSEEAARVAKTRVAFESMEGGGAA